MMTTFDRGSIPAPTSSSVPVFLRLPEGEKGCLLREAREVGLTLNAYVVGLLRSRGRIDVCGGEEEVRSSVAAVAYLRSAFGKDLSAVYRLYDSESAGWRGVALVDAEYVWRTRAVNRIRVGLRESWVGAEAAVLRLPSRSEVSESEFLTWGEVSLHASPVYLADDRAPRLLSSVRARIAEGEWTRSRATRGWVRRSP